MTHFTDRRTLLQRLAIHNIGRGTQEDKVLFAHELNGHFRWKLA